MACEPYEILSGMQVKIVAGCGNRNDWRSSLSKQMNVGLNGLTGIIFPYFSKACLIGPFMNLDYIIFGWNGLCNRNISKGKLSCSSQSQ